MSSRRQEHDPLELRGQELLGRYVVDAILAHGGMSVVYQAFDERLRRAVCIKVFHRLDPREPAYRTTWEHFVQEAFALSQLKHPNTLRIYDFGYLDHEPRSPFHVCELLDGGTLSRHVRREGPLAPRTALEILDPVIGALSEAHGRGIVHRDLKPNNVLFGNAGTRRIVKLVDFGIAKALTNAAAPLPHRAEDTADIGGQEISLYTPGWAAPEQMRTGPIQATSDVFSLGLLTAYMLTGKSLFSLRGAQMLIEHRDVNAHVAKRLDELRVTPPLAEVIVRACRMAPEERYASVDAFGTALHEAAQLLDRESDRDSPLPPASLPPASPPPASLPPSSLPPASLRTASLPPASPRSASLPLAPPRSEPSAAPTPALLSLAGAAEGDFLAAGRRLHVLTVREQVDIGGTGGRLRSPARLRLTFLPNSSSRLRLHVKGLNCFVARSGERPSSAASLDTDHDIDLMSPDRRPLDVLRCLFGAPCADAAMIFPLGAVNLVVPPHLCPAIIIDLGPGRELALLNCARQVAVDGGRR